MSERNRTSTISRLPPDVKRKIAALRDQGCTLDQIMAALDAVDIDVSRSALGRYTKKMDRVAANIRRSREMAQAVARQFGGQEASEVSRTNLEILHTMIMKMMTGPDDQDGEVSFDAKDTMFIATALEKLTKASKVDLDARILAAREQERKIATEKAAEKAVATAISEGISDQTVNKIKASILGIEA